MKKITQNTLFKGKEMQKTQVVKTEFNYDEIKEYIRNNPDAKIFVGTDSQRIKKESGSWIARYVTAIVVYEKDNNKIFGQITRERDYDYNPSKPVLRMMKEVEKTSKTVTELWDVIKDRDFEIHIDVNPKESEGSHVAFNQAIGYIMGMHGVKPIFKPEAWCSSKVADHLVRNNGHVQ